MGRFSSSLYAAYPTFYVIGILALIVIHFVGFIPLRSCDDMATAIVNHLSSVYYNS
jgi:hypothetical protein